MGWTEFALIGIGCALTILIFRTVPLFALRGRELPGWLSQALAFIPPAAFAALIANDIFSPGMFDAGLWPAMIPVIAALIVIPVAIKTKSLVWSIVAGVGSRVREPSAARRVVLQQFLHLLLASQFGSPYNYQLCL